MATSGTMEKVPDGKCCFCREMFVGEQKAREWATHVQARHGDRLKEVSPVVLTHFGVEMCLCNRMFIDAEEYQAHLLQCSERREIKEWLDKPFPYEPPKYTHYCGGAYHKTANKQCMRNANVPETTEVPSAFLLFCSYKYESFVHMNTIARENTTVRAKALAEEWKAMSQEEKAPYFALEENDTRLYVLASASGERAWK